MNRTYNTGETDESLRNEYNPEGSTMRKAQMRMLDMLLYLQEAGRKCGARPRLDGGSVLGSLRHGGFIPWDDDADVVVSREDYKKIVDYLEKHPHPQYVVQTNRTDKGYYKEWATLRDLNSEYVSLEPVGSRDWRSHQALRYKGLHIDIFPYEPYVIPWMQRLAAKLSCVVNFDLAGRYPMLAQGGYMFLHNIVFPVFRITGRIFGSRDCFMHSYGAWFYEQNPRDAMLPLKPIVFEGHTFDGPADPEKLCRIAYGNYMELPPRDKRNRHNTEIKIW